MIDITCEIGGRSVNPRNVKDAIEKAILTSVVENVKKRVRSTSCPEHLRGPKIKVKGSSLSSFKMDVSGCCTQYVDKVKKELN